MTETERVNVPRTKTKVWGLRGYHGISSALWRQPTKNIVSANYRLSTTFLLLPRRLVLCDPLKLRTSTLHVDEVCDNVVKKGDIKNIFNRVGLARLWRREARRRESGVTSPRLDAVELLTVGSLEVELLMTPIGIPFARPLFEGLYPRLLLLKPFDRTFLTSISSSVD